MKRKPTHKHHCQACGNSIRCGGESCIEIHIFFCVKCGEPFSEAFYEIVDETFADAALDTIETWHERITECYSEAPTWSIRLRLKPRWKIIELMFAHATRDAAEDVLYGITYTNN